MYTTDPTMPLRFDIDYQRLPALPGNRLSTKCSVNSPLVFIELPKGEGFIDYPTFEKGISGAQEGDRLLRGIHIAKMCSPQSDEVPIAFIIFRCILGLSPPEWAYITTEMTDSRRGAKCAARSIDRKFRMSPLRPASLGNLRGITARRIRAMIDAGMRTTLQRRVPEPSRPGLVHRLDKADTAQGLSNLQSIADLGVPYPVLLYERFLGRPFASSPRFS